MGLGFGTQKGAVFYAVAHGFIKRLLFLCSGKGEEKGAPDLARSLSIPAAMGLALGRGPWLAFSPGVCSEKRAELWVPARSKAVLLLFASVDCCPLRPTFPALSPPGLGKAWRHPLAFVARGLWGLFVYRPLLSPRTWGEALLAAGLGLWLPRLLRRTQLALPHLGMEAATLASFLGALGLVAVVAFL